MIIGQLINLLKSLTKTVETLQASAEEKLLRGRFLQLMQINRFLLPLLYKLCKKH